MLGISYGDRCHLKALPGCPKYFTWLALDADAQPGLHLSLYRCPLHLHEPGWRVAVLTGDWLSQKGCPRRTQQEDVALPPSFRGPAAAFLRSSVGHGRVQAAQV